MASAPAKRTNKYRRAQSAMEYLMTYGWAILIIAVVLGALFQLGVFNANFFQPKVPPGGCEVLRSDGPGTVQNIALEGECNGGMPQMVTQFNGGSSDIVTPLYTYPTSTGWTEAAWVDVYGSSASWCGGGHSNVVLNDRGSGSGDSLTLSTGPGGSSSFPFFFGWDTNGVGDFATSDSIYNYNTWYFLTGTYNSTYGFSLYVNGDKVAYYTNSGSHGPGGTCTAGALPNSFPSTFPWIIGYHQAWNSYFDGAIANIQIYNSSLSANEVSSLYLEGIGGAPVSVVNLLAWWPLNGDTKDYSGNDNTGAAVNIDYTGIWENGYTVP
ncbi:MAG: LamG domain-containing protein [Candidatus Marsarchaeota archaeon]|nr:LamG domain-containing protein [Candidatus Marsarchaeota archaeon]